MSNYAETLKKKLQLHKDTNFVEIDTDIEELISLANQSSDEYKKLKQDVEALENEDVDFRIPVGDDSRANKEFGLLGTDIKQACNEITFNQSTNQIQWLQHLQQFTLTGFKN